MELTQLIALNAEHALLCGEALRLGRGEGGAEAVGSVFEAGHQCTPVDAGAVQGGHLLGLELGFVLLYGGALGIGGFLPLGGQFFVTQDRLCLHHHHVGGLGVVDLGSEVDRPGCRRDGCCESRGQGSQGSQRLASHAGVSS